MPNSQQKQPLNNEDTSGISPFEVDNLNIQDMGHPERRQFFQDFDHD
jgi:hypothetical protein